MDYESMWKALKVDVDMSINMCKEEINKESRPTTQQRTYFRTFMAIKETMKHFEEMYKGDNNE